MAKGFNLTAEINLRGPSNIRQVVGNIRKQLGSINTNVNVQINQKTAKQISTANKSFLTFNKTLRQTQVLASSTSKSLANLATSAQKLSSSLQSAPQKISQVAQSASQISQNNQQAAQATNALTSEFEEFGRQSALAVRRFAAFATVTGVIYKVSNAVNSAAKDFLSFEKELIKVAQVSRTSIGSLDFLTQNITRLSTGLGVASNDLIGISRTLAQAGLSASDTSKALQALGRSALAPTFDDLNRTVEGSIALMKQFGIGANQLEGALGSINAVAGRFAVEAGDIITAISRAGGVFASASKGVSEGTDALNQFIAVFTSVRATTRESAETIATGLRTIFTRIQRTDTIDSLKAFGITLTDLEGKFVGPYKAIQLLSQGLRTLDPRDLRFGRIVEELGGFRQIGKVIPLIQQFSTAQRALNVAQQGSGSLARDAAIAQQGLANQIQKVQEQFTALIRSIAGSSGFRDLARAALDISSALISVADAAKGALPALTAIFAIKGFKALTQFSGGFLGGLRRGGGNTLNSGGYVKGYATGGLVPGSGSRDTVPAMLTPGEFVVRKKAVAALGTKRLHKINQYARGGSVQDYPESAKHVLDPKASVKWRKKKGEGFETSGKNKSMFNPNDKFEYAFSQTDFNLNRYGDSPAKTAYMKAAKSGDAAERGRKFEDFLEERGLITKSGGGGRGKGQTRIDAFGPNNELIEIKSYADTSSLEKNINKKVISSALNPVGQADQVIANAFKNNVNLTKQGETFQLPAVQLYSDTTSGLGQTVQNTTKKNIKTQNANLGGYIHGFASGGDVKDTVPAMLTPGEFVINKKAASRIGSEKLNSLNKADRVKGYNKGGYVGGIQSFQSGGEVYDFIDNIEATTPAAERAMDDLLANIIGQIVKQQPNISFDDARIQAENQVGGPVSSGLIRAAETGDQNAAKMVADAQKKQRNVIIKQIRANNKNISISDARAMAEKQIGQQWGGYIKQVKTGAQTQQKINQSGKNLTAAQNKNAQANNKAAATTGSTGGQQDAKAIRNQRIANAGTFLAFGAPMIADQVGGAIGGTTGAGVSGAATGFSSAVAVGAQFGPMGAAAGALAGLVLAIDGFNSAVAQKESELASIAIDKAVSASEAAMERFSKNTKDASAQQALIANFNKIQQQETKKAEANEKAAQPGMMSSALSFITGGAFGGDRRTEQDISGQAIADNEAGGAAARAIVDKYLSLGKTLDETSAAISAGGGSLDALYAGIVEASPAFQEQAAEINSGNKAQALKTLQINKLKEKMIEEQRATDKATSDENERARAAKAVSKALIVQSASITRTFNNLNSAVDGASSDLAKASTAIKKIVSGATGFTANLKSVDVLANPSNFSREEQNAAIRQGSQFAGRDSAFMEQMSRFSLDVNDIIAGEAARGQQAGDAPQKVAENTVDAVTKQLEAQFGQTALTDQIRKSLAKAIADGGDGVDIQKVLEENIPEFNLGNQALEAAAKSAKFLQEALQFAANGANEYGKLQQSLRDSQATYQNTILQSNIALKQALGERVDVRERISARTQVDATRAGVGANNLNATDLGRRRDNLKIEVDNINDALNKMANDSENTGGRTSKAFLSLTKKLGDTESSLKATEAAIANLPKSIESNINDIIGEIGRIAQEQQAIQSAGAQFGEQLVGSTPQELAQLSNTFKILDGTLSGNVTTFRQSQAAQQAYFQALRNGSTQQEAFASAQQAFASQTKDALGLFNQLSTMSGLEGPEINNIRATLLEGFAKAQGMGMENSPIFRTIIDNLRADPGESQEIQALKGMLQQQQASLIAATEGVQQGVLDKQNDILKATSDYFLSRLEQVKLNFNTAQLRGTSLGISRPGDTTGAKNLAKGGVVYASDGTYVDYQPRGTDTVPAMLTPGEFVVNRKATQKHRGLLHAINGGTKAYSRGGTVYAAGGVDTLGDITNMPGSGLFQTNLMGENFSFSESYLDGVDKKTLSFLQRYMNLGSGRYEISARGASTAASTARNARNASSAVASVDEIGGMFPTFGRWLKKIRGVGSSLGGSGSNVISRVTGGISDLLSANMNMGTLDTLVDTAVQGGRGSLDLLHKLGTQVGTGMSNVRNIGSSGPVALATKLLGPIVGAVTGLAADTRKTSRNRIVNTLLGASTGTGTTMGDVGAQSTLGYALGAEQGGTLDTALGNFSQLGLTTGQYVALGFPPPAAGLIAAGAMNVQEVAGLMGDRSILKDTEAAVKAQKANQRATGLQTFNPEGFTAQEAAWIKTNDQLERKLARTSNNNPETRAFIQQRLDEHKATKENVFSDTTGDDFFGYTTERTKTDAEIDAAIQTYKKDEDLRIKEQRAIDRKKADEKRSADWQAMNANLAAQMDENRKASKARAEERRKKLGLPANATTEEVLNAQRKARDLELAEQKKKKRLGLPANATEAEVNAAQTQKNKLAQTMNQPDRMRENRNNTDPMKLLDNVENTFGSVDAFDEEDRGIYKKGQMYQKEIDRVENEGPPPFYIPPETPQSWAEAKNRRLKELYDLRDEQVKILDASFRDKGYDTPEGLAKAKRKHDYAEKREKRRETNRKAEARYQELMSVAKYLNLQVPDKFENPQAFENFRKNLRKRLDREYGGMASANPDYLRSIGVPDSLLKAAYEPFSSEQLSAIYGGMAEGTNLSAGAQKLARALSLSKKRMAAGLEKDPKLQAIIANASPEEKAEIRKSFSSSYVKQANAYSRYDRLAANYQNMNPRQQQMFRANMEKNLTRQGVFNPNAKPDDNIGKMNAFGAPNLARVMYPDKQTQNKSIRVKKVSQGGIIYASEGTLVPYEPRGTDTVPAMLTPGEFVINRRATQKHRPLLESINRSKGGSVSYFEEGGNVTTGMVDGVPVERENPLIKKMDENIAKTTQTMKIATTGRNVSQQGLTNIKDGNQVYNDDRHKGTPANTASMTDLANHVTHEHQKTIKLIVGLKLIKDSDFADFMLGGTDASGARFAAKGQIPFAGRQPLPVQGQAGGMDAADFLKELFNFSKGGVVYASEGKYVNYEPKGTDTIPAMLTPGEYVVNAKASQKNLGLLQAINSGAMSTGGIVYADKGGKISNNTAMDMSETQGAVQALAAKLAPYASDNGKLQEAASRMFGITSVGTDTEHFTDSPFDAQVIGTNPNQSEIKFRDTAQMSNSNLVLHEFAHALQNSGRDAGPSNSNVTSIQSGIKAKLGPQIKKYYEEGFSGIGFTGGYSNSDMLEQPNELMANMVINPESLSSVGKGLLKGMMKYYGYSKGGPVYASNGMLIPYRPQGTDTVPAMLTPGEFVVNKTATQQHLPALQAMNQGGRVAYLNNGTPGIGALTELNSAIRPLIDSFKALSQNMTTQGVSTNSSNINVEALGQFTSTLNTLLGQLSNIGQQIPQIPSEVNFNMAPIRLQVDITGAEALAALEPGLQDIAETQIQVAIDKFKNNSFDIA